MQAYHDWLRSVDCELKGSTSDRRILRWGEEDLALDLTSLASEDPPQPYNASMCTALSPNGQLLAVALGGKLTLIENQTLEVRREWQLPSSEVCGLDFDPTSRYLAAAWDSFPDDPVSPRECVAVFDTLQAPRSQPFSRSNQQRLVSTLMDALSDHLKIDQAWSRSECEEHAQCNLGYYIEQKAEVSLRERATAQDAMWLARGVSFTQSPWSPASRQLLTVCEFERNTVPVLVDKATGSRCILTGLDNNFACSCFSSDGSVVYVVSYDKKLTVFSTGHGSPQGTLLSQYTSEDHLGGQGAMAIRGDDNVLAVSSNGRVTLFDVSDASRPRKTDQMDLPLAGWIRSLHWRADQSHGGQPVRFDSQCLWIGSFQGIHVQQVTGKGTFAACQDAWLWSMQPEREHLNYQREIMDITFSADGSHVAIHAPTGQVYVYNFQGERCWLLEPDTEVKASTLSGTAHFLPKHHESDDERLICCHRDSTARIWTLSKDAPKGSWGAKT